MGLGRIRKRRVGRSGNSVTLHESFGKYLGTLQLGRSPGGPENSQAVRTELVDDALRKRTFRTDHGQADFFLLRPGAQLVKVGDG